MIEKDKYYPPKTCEMPKLPDNFGKTLLSHILNVTLSSGGPSDYVAAAYSINFIRSSDLAIQEYNLARKALVEFIETPNNVMSPLFLTIGHLEFCINAMRRAIRFSRHKHGPKLPRIDVISSNVSYRIRNIRDAIEHTDERIRDEKIVQGKFLMLAVKSDGIELEGKEILYSELAEWLKQLHELSSIVAAYREENN